MNGQGPATDRSAVVDADDAAADNSAAIAERLFPTFNVPTGDRDGRRKLFPERRP